MCIWLSGNPEYSFTSSRGSTLDIANLSEWLNEMKSCLAKSVPNLNYCSDRSSRAHKYPSSLNYQGLEIKANICSWSVDNNTIPVRAGREWRRSWFAFFDVPWEAYRDEDGNPSLTALKEPPADSPDRQLWCDQSSPSQPKAVPVTKYSEIVQLSLLHSINRFDCSLIGLKMNWGKFLLNILNNLPQIKSFSKK